MSEAILRHLQSLRIIPFGGAEFQPASEPELLSLEGELGIRLPDELRDVLLRIGEATFDVEVVFDTRDGGRYIIGWLYGFQSMHSTFRSPPDQFPPASLPIGEEGLGNYYCLGLRGRFAGQVLYWDHEIGWGEAKPYVIREALIPDGVSTPCLRVLANSYAEFILGFRTS
jgi:SMI1 / KNR4 family (SUKH-1)